jgi:hypothetical protein
MGCDIHAFVEVNVPKKGWVMVHAVNYRFSGGDNLASRNYQRFAALAGVRGEGPQAKGVPKNASDGYKWHVEKWGIDGHSHSYLSAREAANIAHETRYGKDTERADAFERYNQRDLIEHYCDVTVWDEKDIDKYRVVFFFDN